MCQNDASSSCGKRGIQTPGTARPFTGFRVRPDRSLWHLSLADAKIALIFESLYDFVDIFFRLVIFITIKRSMNSLKSYLCTKV
jgi:hypothetical protein